MNIYRLEAVFSFHHNVRLFIYYFQMFCKLFSNMEFIYIYHTSYHTHLYHCTHIHSDLDIRANMQIMVQAGLHRGKTLQILYVCNG